MGDILLQLLQLALEFADKAVVVFDISFVLLLGPGLLFEEALVLLLQEPELELFTLLLFFLSPENFEFFL